MLRSWMKFLPVNLVVRIAKRRCERISVAGTIAVQPFDDVLIVVIPRPARCGGVLIADGYLSTGMVSLTCSKCGAESHVTRHEHATSKHHARLCDQLPPNSRTNPSENPANIG